MPVHNADITAIVSEIAEPLEIQGASPFRIRTYRNAALTLGKFGLDLAAVIRNGDALPKIAGVGDDLWRKIREIATTGHCSLLDCLHKELAITVTEPLKIPGLGPKRVKALYEELHLHGIASLRSAAKQGRIQALPGFGAKTEQRNLQATHAQGAHTQHSMPRPWPTNCTLPVARKASTSLAAFGAAKKRSTISISWSRPRRAMP